DKGYSIKKHQLKNSGIALAKLTISRLPLGAVKTEGGTSVNLYRPQAVLTTHLLTLQRKHTFELPMTEYNSHLSFYKYYPHMHFSKLVSEKNWGNEKLGKNYLEKYWLHELEYLNFWKSIQDEIFVQGSRLPELIYRPEFELVVENGGCLFAEDDFEKLQKTLQRIGDDHFVIIQHTQDFKEGEPMFRMKFPVNITWEELTSGNYISAVLLEMPYNEYYIFGASRKWGKYSANDYDRPLDIIGFKPELESLFKNHFKRSKEEYDEMLEWMPKRYKSLIK
ncbi:MAG: hypothetical protein DI539_27100, partial [Flavobacterium psychrophilum]